MSIVDGKGLIVWEGGLFEPGSDLLRRVQWAFAQIRAAGGTIILNEAGRPFGVPGDANVRSSSQTASGLSTVWFQWGRYLRGETPSAADPRSGNVYASEHTQGIAIDCNAVDVYTTTLRAKYFPQVGLRNTISSESWHWAIRGNPTVNLGTGTASTGSKPITPIHEEDEDMDGFYIQTSGPGPKFWFSPSTGKLRAISSAEWSFLRAVESTAGGLAALGRPIQVITVSENWLAAAKKL